jgi:hypothetical protein
MYNASISGQRPSPVRREYRTPLGSLSRLGEPKSGEDSNQDEDYHVYPITPHGDVMPPKTGLSLRNRPLPPRVHASELYSRPEGSTSILANVCRTISKDATCFDSEPNSNSNAQILAHWNGKNRRRDFREDHQDMRPINERPSQLQGTGSTRASNASTSKGYRIEYDPHGRTYLTRKQNTLGRNGAQELTQEELEEGEVMSDGLRM